MPFTLTAEQTAIIEAACETQENLLISARAGSAKTTTIELIAQALPTTTTLAIAFNKKIADELRLRLPPNCESVTLNALGHRAWKDFIGKHPKVSGGKTYFMLKEELEKLPPSEAKEVSENFRDLLDAIRTAKSKGYLPSRPHSRCRPLIEDDSFFDLLEVRLTPIERELLNTIVLRSFTEAILGNIDFDDQILCPTIMPASFPSFELVMIDEAQDLSRINQLMLAKIAKRSRLIAVGDEAQAIYGFRGASEQSMPELRRMFDMREMHLTICFRSSQSVIAEAQWRAPDMRHRDGAPIGTVLWPDSWSASDLQDGDAIICRNNAPLFHMAVELLRAKRLPELASGDITKGLIATMKKLGKRTDPQGVALEALEKWESQQSKRHKDKKRVEDQAACIRVFLLETETLGDAITFFEDITARKGHIKLSTGHKAKGLEFDRVWFLDQHLLRHEGQDLNLRYVIQTRAREQLAYVTTKSWRMEKEAA